MTRFFLEISKVAFGGTGNWNWHIGTGIGNLALYWHFGTGIGTLALVLALWYGYWYFGTGIDTMERVLVLCRWYWYLDTGISTCRCTGNRYWRIGTLLFMHLSLAAAFTLAILIVPQGEGGHWKLSLAWTLTL